MPDAELPMLLDSHADILNKLGRTDEAQHLQAEAQRWRVSLALKVRVPIPDSAAFYSLEALQLAAKAAKPSSTGLQCPCS